MSETKDRSHWFFKANKILLLAMLIMTTAGLYCPAGNFYIDPSRGVDHAVVTHAHSDHADWDELVQTVKDTGAKKVYVQHRGKGAPVRHLQALGLEAYSDADLFPKNPHQLNLF